MKPRKPSKTAVKVRLPHPYLPNGIIDQSITTLLSVNNNVSNGNAMTAAGKQRSI